MAVKIEDLDRGVLNKLPGLAPVPPKPDVKGLTRGKLMQTMKRYYEENKAAILADFEQLGEAAMLRRWDIPDSTWPILRANFMPERFQLPDWKRKTSRCDHCANAYEHDEQRWCAVARCPSRLRSGIRLPFRPDPVPPRPTGKQEERSSQAVPEERQVIVHVYQLDGFPPFEKCSTAESQCEWLRCYRDLALAAPGEKIFNQRGT